MAKTSLGELSARVSLDTVDFTRNLASLKRELRLAKTDMDLAAKGVHGFDQGLTKTEAQMKLVERQVELNQQSMKRYSDEYEAAAKAARNSDGEITKSMQNAQRKHQEARLEVERLTEQYRELYKLNAREQSTFYQASDIMEKVGGRMKTVGKGMESVGRTWTRVGTAVGLAAGGLVKSAMDFESAMANVQKTTNMPADEIERLGREIRDLSHEIPVAAHELGEMAALGGQLGILPEHLAEFTEVTAALGVATNMTGEEAGTMMAQFANITNMPQDQFDQLASSIVKIGNNTATTEKDVSEMAMHLAGAGEAAGLSQSEIIGLAGGLSSLGIAAQRGGSSFSRIMIDMATASETGVDAARELEQATGHTIRELELMSSNSSADFRAVAESVGMTRQEVMKIVNSANDLQGFADIAGMTAEEFATAFGEDAVGAIGLFIDGLSRGEEAGESAIQILDDLGISEIRLRDTLLRAGNARGVLNETVEMSNDAFRENTELMREADIYYGTTESQMKIFRNRVQDVAIEMGTALLPALMDLLDSADPLIEMFSDLADWFVSLDDDTKQWITTLGGIAIVGGPILTILGKFTSGFGSILSVLGKSGKALFDWSIDTQTAGASLDTMRDGVDGVTGKLAGGKGLTRALHLLNPKVVAITAAVGAGVYAWQEWIKPAIEARERTNEWGEDIGEEAQRAIDNFRELGLEAQTATMEMARDIEGGATRAMEAYSEIGQNLLETNKETINSMRADYEELSPEVQRIVGGMFEEQIAGHEDVRDHIEQIMEQITAIYERSIEENRQLTKDEEERIKSLNEQLADVQAEMLEINAETQRKVREQLNNDLKALNDEQLEELQNYHTEELALTGDHYEEQRRIVIDAYGDVSELTAEQAEERRRALAEINNQEYEDLVHHTAESLLVWKERGLEQELVLDMLAHQTSEYGVSVKDVLAEAVVAWQEMGYSQEEILAMLDDSSVMFGETWESMGINLQDVFIEAALVSGEKANDIVSDFLITADAMEGLSTKGKQHANTWNQMFDEMAEGSTDNMRTVLREMGTTQEGWESLEFIAKELPLTTEAKEMLFEAMVVNADWNDSQWMEHFLGLETNAYDIALTFLQAHEDWENIDPKVVELLMSTQAPEVVRESLIEYGVWDKLPNPLKTLLMDSEVPSETSKAEQAIDDYMNFGTRRLNPITLKAEDGVSEVVSRVKRNLATLPTSRTVTVRTQNITENYVRDMNARGITHQRNAAGSNFHPGGLAVLGDGGQHEPYLTPQGVFGVSPNKDTMYDVPRGTKIWRSMEALLKDIPRYANGTTNQPVRVGDKVFSQISDALVPFSQTQAQAVNNSGSTVVQGDTYNINLSITGDLPHSTIKRMADTIQREIKQVEDRRKIAKGEGWAY